MRIRIHIRFLHSATVYLVFFGFRTLFKSFVSASRCRNLCGPSSGKPTCLTLEYQSIKHGKEIKLVTPPNETVILNVRFFDYGFEKLTSPVVKERMDPAPVASK